MFGRSLLRPLAQSAPLRIISAMYLIKHDIEKYGSATVGMFSEATGIPIAELLNGAMLDRPAMLARLYA